MSLHHQMMLHRYGLGRPGDMHSAVCADPILTPLLIQAGLGGTFFTIGTATISYAAVATAIVTTSITRGVQTR